MLRYLLLNGPPYSGKSTTARVMTQYLQSKGYRVAQDSFAAPLKHFFATALGVKYAEMKKDTMMGALHGYTPRESLIDLSEAYIKRRFGEDIYARWLVHRTVRLDPLPDVVIVDDLGFPYEADAMASRRIIRITRPGYDFSNDSRVYVSNPDYTVDNDGTQEQLEERVRKLCDQFA
jgi:hypothetical protein